MRILESDRISTDTISSMVHVTANAALAFSLRRNLGRCDLGHRPEQPTKPWDSPQCHRCHHRPAQQDQNDQSYRLSQCRIGSPNIDFLCQGCQMHGRPARSGRYTVRGSSHGRFSTGRGSHMTGIAFCPTAGIEAAHTLRSARAAVSMSCVLNGLVAFRSRAIFPAAREAAAR
jgi:hypothetical protein